MILSSNVTWRPLCMWRAVSCRGRSQGALAPKVPKIHLKIAPNFFFFLPRTLLGRLTAATQGSGILPPLQTNCWLRPCHLLKVCDV